MISGDATLPPAHAEFLERALPRLAADDRLVGVAAGGSFVTDALDAYSDLDLVIAVEPTAYAEVERSRLEIAAGLGSLLAGFTGEHVGEPRVLICLYDAPLLHVDLKFVSLEDLADRVEDPVVLWERDDAMSERFEGTEACFPAPDLQWIEDRFWVWIHYGVTKIGRGEIFEALDFLAYLRMQVLGPLMLQAAGARPTGVRKIETLSAEAARRLRPTVADYDPASCARALRACAALYGELRAARRPASLDERAEAERAAMRYLDQIEAGLGR